VNLKGTIRALEDLIKRINRKLKRAEAAKKAIGVTKYESRGGFVMFSDATLGGLVVADDDAKQYRAGVEAIYVHVSGKAERISRYAVESAIQKAMLTAIDPAGNSTDKNFSRRLCAALDGLKRELTSRPVDWEVHFPIEGIAPNGLPRTFGNCEFYFGNDAYISSLLRRVDRIVVSLVEAESRDESRRDASETVRSLATGKTGVGVKVQAVDRDAALYLAKKVSRQTVDTLNFYANLGEGPPAEVLLFSEGRGPGVLYTFLFGEQPPAFQTPAERFGPYLKFSFHLPHLPGTGFERVSEMLAKAEKDRTAIEEKILSALRWAGRASVDPRREEAFLLFAISLESLLMKTEGDRAEITEKLALRGAHLVARNLQSRLTVYRDLKKLYGIRSKIVHSGSVDVGESQFNEIRHYGRLAVLTMLSSPMFRDMKTEEELANWFQQKLLEAHHRKGASPR